MGGKGSSSSTFEHQLQEKEAFKKKEEESLRLVEEANNLIVEEA